jgi:hypothetical protein
MKNLARFGFYRISGLPARRVYILQVRAPRYSFGDPIRTITLNDDAAGEDFIALPK